MVDPRREPAALPSAGGRLLWGPGVEAVDGGLLVAGFGYGVLALP